MSLQQQDAAITQAVDPVSKGEFDELLGVWASGHVGQTCRTVKTQCCGARVHFEQVRIIRRKHITTVVVGQGGELIAGCIEVYLTACPDCQAKREQPPASEVQAAAEALTSVHAVNTEAGNTEGAPAPV
jgi:hypothetical protein